MSGIIASQNKQSHESNLLIDQMQIYVLDTFFLSIARGFNLDFVVDWWLLFLLDI